VDILVFVKRVPDTESKIRVNTETNSVIEDGLNFIISPYDEYAMEEALRIREARGGKITAISAGKEEALTILRKCLAMGADEAALIKDPHSETYDGLRAARLLAACVKKKFPGARLLLFGKQSVGADNGQVPAMVAELLGLPQANVVVKLELEGDGGTALREIEGGLEKVEFTLPAVISAQKGLNEPRYETLKGIMAAKKKEIPIITIDELGIEEKDLAPQVVIARMEMPPARQAGRVTSGPPEETAPALASFLHNEAKVI